VARYIDAYERLRSAVLESQPSPSGLAAVRYHGLLGGLKIICATVEPLASTSPVGGATPDAASLVDPALVRMLANMVLIYHHQEVTHVVG